MGIFWDETKRCYIGSKFVNGKRKRKSLKQALTKQERETLYYKWVSEAPSDISKMLFDKYFREEWCEVTGKSLNPKTLSHYKRSVSLVMQYRPKTKLKDIDVKFLEKLKTEWVDCGISLPKIHKSIKNIKKIQNDARKWGDAGLVTWRDVQNVKVIKKRGNEPFWPEESELLIKKAKQLKHRTILKATLLGMYAGLRDAECCYLDKKDIDIQRNVININPNKPGVNGILLYPKGTEGRQIPIHPILRPYLIQWINQDKSSHIIFNEEHNEKRGHRIRPDSLSKMYSNFVKECGIKGTHHKLRHTFITFSIASGIDFKTLQEWTGHKDLKVLLEYVHWVPQTNEKINMLNVFGNQEAVLKVS